MKSKSTKSAKSSVSHMTENSKSQFDPQTQNEFQIYQSSFNEFKETLHNLKLKVPLPIYIDRMLFIGLIFKNFKEKIKD